MQDQTTGYLVFTALYIIARLYIYRQIKGIMAAGLQERFVTDLDMEADRSYSRAI